jgi:hypothetical protein
MATKNDITGDTLRTKGSNKDYDAGWDRIFGKNKERVDTVDSFWSHTCKIKNVKLSTKQGQACSWCGLKEDGSLD